MLQQQIYLQYAFVTPIFFSSAVRLCSLVLSKILVAIIVAVVHGFSIYAVTLKSTQLVISSAAVTITAGKETRTVAATITIDPVSTIQPTNTFDASSTVTPTSDSLPTTTKDTGINLMYTTTWCPKIFVIQC